MSSSYLVKFTDMSWMLTSILERVRKWSVVPTVSEGKSESFGMWHHKRMVSLVSCELLLCPHQPGVIVRRQFHCCIHLAPESNNMWVGPSSIVLVVRTSGHSVYNIRMADACCENFPQPWDVTAIRLLDIFIPFVFVTLWFLAQQPANRLAGNFNDATFQRVILNRLRINSVSGTFFFN